MMVQKPMITGLIPDDKILITDSEYIKLSRLLMDATGIKLPPSKKAMVTARLSKRLRHLGISSFNNYYNFLISEKGKQDELIFAINAISTNKTEFFRDRVQFELLTNTIIPSYLEENGHAIEQLKIWSAGCSSGQEPYSIAMAIDRYAEIPYSITATDISSRVLEKAENALYKENEIEQIPLQLRKKYILRGKNSYQGLYSISTQIKQNISFQQHNLITGTFDKFSQMDIIFCRNVLIYFEKESQLQIIKKFHHALKRGGYLFIGSSETLFNLNDYFSQQGPNLYKKIMVSK